MAHVRIKYQDRTVFVYAEPTDTIETIISRLISMTKSPLTADEVGLVWNGFQLEPFKPLSYYTSEDSVSLQEVHKVDGKWV